MLSETLGLIEAACAKATCPIIQARCKWIEDNKEEFTGYLVAKIRPMHDGQQHNNSSRKTKKGARLPCANVRSHAFSDLNLFCSLFACLFACLFCCCRLRVLHGQRHLCSPELDLG